MAPVPRFTSSVGPALLSAGFRPVFLFGALYAGVAIALWLPEYFGAIRIETTCLPRGWRMHKPLYGYIAAIVIGVLFTAIPNCTGRLSLQGPLLLA